MPEIEQMETRTIFKYSFDVTDHTRLRMPEGAKILSVQHQDPSKRRLVLWALVHPHGKAVEHDVFVVGTGHWMRRDVDERHFVGTVEMRGSEYAGLWFHVFVRSPE